VRLDDPRRESIAWAIAAGENQAYAARAANVDRGTVTRWMKEEPLLRRIDELKIMMAETPEDGGAERGLARLVPIAEQVIEAALKGEPYNGKPVTAQQHQNALRTIDLAHKLHPRETTGATGAPALQELIRAADAHRAGS
jgi:hypothetical protein